MTSVINHSIDRLLQAARECREVVRLGAVRVTMLSGVVVTAAEEVLRVVSEGGGMRQSSPHVRKVTTKVGTLAPLSERLTK